MAGSDYLEWEEEDDLEFPPPHLLADEEEEGPSEPEIKVTCINYTSHYDLQSKMIALVIVLLIFNFSDKRVMGKKLFQNEYNLHNGEASKVDNRNTMSSNQNNELYCIAFHRPNTYNSRIK
ncbi:hypothetical protein V6N13_111317 [Hibiscus sabdariffa]